MNDKIKRFFVWIFTAIGLILLVIGSVGFANLALKTYVFPKADYSYCPMPLARMNPVPAEDFKQEQDNYKQCQEQRSAQRQRDAAQSLAFILIGLPIFAGFYKKTK